MAQVSTDYFTNNTTAILTAGLTVLLLVIFNLTRRDGKKLPPGPMGLPIVGNLFNLAFTKLFQHELVWEWSKKYGDVLWFKVFGTGVVIINDIDIMQETFQKSDVCDRPAFYAFDRIVDRKCSGIACAKGEVWKEQRAFFVSVFRKVDIGVSRLEDIVGEQVQNIVSQIKNLKGQNLDPTNMINMSIANIITRIITGLTYNWEDPRFMDIVACSGKLFDNSGPAALFVMNPVFARLPIPVNWEIRRVTLQIVNFIKVSIADHKKNFDPKATPKDFIEAYLHEMAKGNGKYFDDTNLIASCFDTLVAGWETVASTLRWTIFILATHPEAQNRMRQEIHDVVGTERLPTIADRPNMPLTEATIAECMRFVSAVPIHLPHITNRDCKIAGYDIPEGTAVAGNLLHFAKSPSLWQDPEDFKPERFLNESGNFKRGSEPFPFGYGKRQCPGEQLARMEMFIFTTYLVQNFDLRLPSGASSKFVGHLGITWRPKPYVLQCLEINANHS